MANRLGELDLDEAAKVAAGNWKQFDSFVWYRNDIEDADNWCIVYSQHRDSGLIDESNANVIEREMMKFTDGDDADVVSERHDHWLVGWIDGLSIRVFKNSQTNRPDRTSHGAITSDDLIYRVLREVDAVVR